MKEKQVCEKLYEHYLKAGYFNIAYALLKCEKIKDVRSNIVHTIRRLTGDEHQEAVDLYYLCYALEEKYAATPYPAHVEYARREVPAWLEEK